MCITRNIEARSYNYCCSVKTISKTYSECVSVALGTRHGKHIAILSSVTCPALQTFSTVTHKWYDFLKKKK